MKSAKQAVADLLAYADVTIGGTRPWDITVHDDRFYKRVLAGGSLALGESYMDGWWDAPKLDQFFTKILAAELDYMVTSRHDILLAGVLARFTNRQRRSRAFQIAETHYDVGNDLYEAMLDKSMTYTCGYWKDAKTLEAAQTAKLELICRKLGLKKGQTVLDIGCGWGSFAVYAARKYKARVVGITISKEQLALAKERCAGLPIEIRMQDYRDVQGQFDHIVSLGMFEHVGPKNYRAYFEAARRCLKDGGLFLLHTIGGITSVKAIEPWIDKYIFPNSVLPSIAQIGTAIERLFVMEDWHSFGADYDTTLMAWHRNVEKRWPALKARYNERFHRMWTYYLLACAGTFRSRKNQLWQIVLSKDGIPGGYASVR